jgi:hypothetical protein
MAQTPDPSRIIGTGFGFWTSPILPTPVKLEVFTRLGENLMTQWATAIDKVRLSRLSPLRLSMFA